jgi:predicted transcriptional regulator
MAKNRISSQDFLDLLEEDGEPQSVAFHPALHQKPEPKVEPILSQSEAKVEPISRETRAKLEPKLSRELKPVSLKVEPQPEPKVEPILSQSEAKVEPKYSLDALIGLQRQALFFVYESCRISGSKISGPIGIQNLAEATRTTVAAVRKALQRLEQKVFLIRAGYKDGRGGWTKYQLPDSIYNALLVNETRAKVEPKLSQTRAKVGTELEPQPEPTRSCSSSNLNLSNTTTTDPTKSVGELAPFWLSVPKSLDGLVSVKQLREFVRQGLVSEDVLQTSLDGFAFDLEKGAVKAKNGNPVAILIGAIKGGGYISQSYMAELKAALAEVEKTRAELHKIQAENVAELLRVEFESFREKFPEQADKIKPSGKFLQSFEPGSVGYRMWLDAFRVNRAAQNPAVGDAAAKENSSINP